MAYQFSSNVETVIRTLPKAHKETAALYAQDVRQGTDFLLQVARNLWGSNWSAGRAEGLADKIVDELAWADIDKGTLSTDFRRGPAFAAAVSKAAIPIGERMAEGAPEQLRSSRDYINLIAIGFTGLHVTLLGFGQLSTDPGKGHFERALTKYKNQIFVPVGETLAPIS